MITQAKKLYLKDFYLLIVLLFFSFFSVYYMPVMFNRIAFLIILVATFRTKFDYVYLVWFFIINDAPARLFSAGALDDVGRIPLYPLVSGISISFQDLFFALYIYKYLSQKKIPPFIFKKEFTWYLLFGIFVVGYSLLLGMTMDNMLQTFRIFLPWSMIFIVPAYIGSKEKIIRSSLLIFPIVFLAFLSLCYSYVTGDYLNDVLRGVSFSHTLLVRDEFASRSHSAAFIIIFSVIQAFYYLLDKNNQINKNYLGAVIFFGLFSILLTASRGWTIALTFFLFGSLFFTGFSRNIAKWIRIVAVSVIVFWFIGSQFPLIQKQLDATFQRLATLEMLVSGDVTAGGTLQRIDVRGPRVMSKFWESPFVGWGFSNDYYDFADGHVGHQNILLNVGILGYVFVNGLFVVLCMKIWRFSRIKEIRKNEGKLSLIYVFGLMAVFVIHSSSTQFWGIDMGFNQLQKLIFFGFFLAAVNTIYQDYQYHRDNRL
ncbi:hypothetical protein [Desulfotignum phosphitoxidans]|uniref:Putative membrane protein n=1 Tax=Desulfotignum phosphitoxidans DSM 13687 TaxID=1286635 RepID=S0G1S7_9BACT|nr:hypothetical protein [Desulfotignum phosphitoxidans]EMS77656.1 putative membrane protein [Desulfotignum phosphitoxidans DSM 13687]